MFSTSLLKRLLSAFLVCLSCTACTYVESHDQVFVSSRPAGAEIHLDGKDTGLTTPAALRFEDWFRSDHQITLRKPGHEDEVRQIRAYNSGYTSRWIDGMPNDTVSWPWPIFWTLGDMFTPFARRLEYSPRTLHVRLYKTGEAPESSR